MENYLLFGLGASNGALLEHFDHDSWAEKVKLHVSSDKLDELQGVPKKYLLPPDEVSSHDFDRVFVPPGIPLGHWIHSRYEVENEIQFAAQYFSGKMIGITGTNGKSTLCKLVDDVLELLGYKAAIAGNFGTPLTKLIGQDLDYIVIELSSFQLHSLNQPFLDLAVITQIEDDHLDWHVSSEHYYQSKLKIFDLLKGNASKGLVSPDLYPDLLVAKGGVADNVSSCQASSDMHWVNLVPGHLQCSFLLLESILDALNLDKGSIDKLEFTPLDHRMEDLGKVNEIRFVNDSKATTPGATFHALKYESSSRIHLILGGKSKGLELMNLLSGLSLAAHKIEGVSLYGDLWKSREDFVKAGFQVSGAKSWNSMVEKLEKVLTPGQTCLLSPAFSSLDQFSSFKERGEAFKRFVKRM